MLFSSSCFEIPDFSLNSVYLLQLIYIYKYLIPSSKEKKTACSPAIQTIKFVWPS
jgi:hypothetical protein